MRCHLIPAPEIDAATRLWVGLAVALVFIPAVIGAVVVGMGFRIKEKLSGCLLQRN
jgi:hypothetical protein